MKLERNEVSWTEPDRLSVEPADHALRPDGYRRRVDLEAVLTAIGHQRAHVRRPAGPQYLAESLEVTS
ncbi:MAG: hypothetical protein M3N28_00005 [Actinomycetota bacterium]|nr:hypothetical protein [Actinomycetota bacterium]